MRGPVVSLTLLLAGCSFELDLLGDSGPDRCPGTDLDDCVPPGVSAADSAAVEVEIDRVEPVLDSIEVVAGTDLWDPARPIALSSAGDAAICFTGMAAGRQIAGLDVQP